MSHESAFLDSENQDQRIKFSSLRRVSSGVVPDEAGPGTLPPDGRRYAAMLCLVPTNGSNHHEPTDANKYRSPQFVGIQDHPCPGRTQQLRISTVPRKGEVSHATVSLLTGLFASGDCGRLWSICCRSIRFHQAGARL